MKSIVVLVIILAAALASPVNVDLDGDNGLDVDVAEEVGAVLEEQDGIPVTEEGDTVLVEEDSGTVLMEEDDKPIAEDDGTGLEEDNTIVEEEGNTVLVDDGIPVAEEGGMVQLGQSRIVNGNSTTIEHFPWIISMQYYGSHRCGGSIITTNRILTAAHCTFNITASSLSVRAGSTDSQIGGELVTVTEYTNHHLYNPTTLENDISVMIIASRLTTGLGISVIALPMHGASVPSGIVANVAGWGALCEKCPGISTLQYVGLPVLSNADCSSMYGESVTDGMLCAGFVEGGRDACQGDSGGPMNNGNLLIGIVSWGDGCARPNSPGVFTRVSYYRNWINGLL